MKKTTAQPRIFHSIAEVHLALGLPKPLHPLVSLNNYAAITTAPEALPKMMVMNLYKISYKKYFTGKMRYGQQHYDFDEGGLCFIAPNQLIAADEDGGDYDGFTLLIHPDFIRHVPLGKNIRQYGFFAYAVTEALHLSEKEQKTIMEIFAHIQEELESPVDRFSQDVIIAHVELLLHYCSRFYNRQFLTRKAVATDLLARMENLLDDYFNSNQALLDGPATVNYISGQLHLSPGYLSDMLRSLTGQNAQQHIHNKMIDKAKEILSGSQLSVAEIAYQLGFEHPQSFSKIFKRKTSQTPLAFKRSFNTLAD